MFSDDSFASTSAAVIMRLLAQLVVRTSMLLFTVDVKDAFLMIPQPADEKATVTTVNGKYKLLRNLPGQRNAAALWFRGFKDVSTEFGLESDVMQPTLMRKVGSNIDDKEGQIFLTIHVDDLVIVADEGEMQKFMKFLRSKNWSVEVKGPFNMSLGRFKYLKRNIEVVEGGVTIRPDARQIEELAELCGVTKQKPRTTPTDHKFNKMTKEDEKVAEGQVTRFRSWGSCCTLHRTG